MTSGYLTTKGWLEVAADAYADGQRKTCEDMVQEASRALLLNRDSMTADEVKKCEEVLHALVRLLNDGVPKRTLVH